MFYKKLPTSQLFVAIEHFLAKMRDSSIGRMEERDLENEALYTLQDDGIEGVLVLLRQKIRRIEVSLKGEPNLVDIRNAQDDLLDIASYSSLCYAMLTQHVREGGDTIVR